MIDGDPRGAPGTYSATGVTADGLQMTPDGARQPAAGLRIRLENQLPRSLPVGRATAIFCYGHCFHQRTPVTGLELIVGGRRHPPEAFRMPRRDLYEWLTGPHGGGEDPERRSYRSGFWATVTIPAQRDPGALAVQAAIRLSGGGELLVELGAIEIVAAGDPVAAPPPRSPDTIAICMATFNPSRELLEMQVRSLRAQTDERWVCAVSDGGSDPEHFEALLEVLGDDPRFIVSRSTRRLDPYRNFERALEMVPAEASLIALCDQDDRWYPEKLAVTRAALGGAQLVYSDQRLVSEDGRVLRDSLWRGRRNDWRNLASLLVANSVPGAAMLFRRELVTRALPFPDAPGFPFHDHWLALVALSGGHLAYVDRPLYDYVQHSGAVQGAIAAGRPEPNARSRRGSRGWRGAYFGGYAMRRVLAQTLLARCGDDLEPRKRRALALLVDAERSPVAFAWLALRPLRRLIGRDETLGGELPLAQGIVWRRLVTLAAGRRERPGRRPYDASFPDPPVFEQRRLRRWRVGG